MTCDDPNCPKHGHLKTRKGRTKATVVKTGAQGTVVVEWSRIVQVPKYERAYRDKSRVSVHVPGCMQVKKGDQVLIAPTRNLSKTKAHVIVEVLSDGKKD